MRATLISLVLVCIVAPRAATAQIVLFEKDEQKLTLGGTIEPQYVVERPEGQPTIDHAFLRRLILDAEATLSSAWAGSLQVDFGQSTLTIRNAMIQYTGWRARGLTLTIGNQKFPFSRSFTTSGTHRHNPERPFTGDRTFGTLNRVMGIKLDGTHARHRIQWAAALGAATQLSDPKRITFDTPVAHESGAPLTEGVASAGRIEWHPLGETPREQGDFGSPHWRTMFAVAAYRWATDHDQQTTTGADLAHVRGLEFSSGLRGHRVSIDGEMERIDSVALDPRLSADLYRGGRTRLAKGSLEAGYMVVNHRLEVIGGIDAVDTQAYAHAWRRILFGTTWYFRDHGAKLELSHRVNAHMDGRPAGMHETFAQLQLLF